MSSEAFYAQIAQSAEKAFPFIERCGIEVLHVARGECHLRMPLEGNKNHINIMYAGALFTLAEFPGGVVYLTCFDVTKMYPILKGLDINFYRPATTDIEVKISLSDEEIERINATTLAEGKCDFDWQVELINPEGKVVAVADCRYQMRKAGS